MGDKLIFSSSLIVLPRPPRVCAPPHLTTDPSRCHTLTLTCLYPYPYPYPYPYS